MTTTWCMYERTMYFALKIICSIVHVTGVCEFHLILPDLVNLDQMKRYQRLAATVAKRFRYDMSIGWSQQ